MHTSLFRVVLTAFIAIGMFSATALAQKPDNPADKTLLEIEILMPGVGGDPLLAQKWRGVFEELGEAVRIRQPLPSDAPKIEEVPRGPFRLVRLVGEIDRDGNLSFPGKSFKQNQSALLKEYLGELKTYGAQGSPTGKALWGLTKAQFEAVFDQLRAPVEKPVKGLTINEALKVISPARILPLAYHSSTESVRKTWDADKFQGEVQGLSAGTAVAYVLSQQGLGFRPLRTPSGEIQLMIHPLEQAPDAWPVGWPLTETVPRDQSIPGLFKKVETGVNESPLAAVYDAIEAQSGVRILVDRLACLAKELDPETILVSYPRKKTAWALILNSVTVNSHMTMNYRQDEAGTGFIFVTPFAHYEPKNPTQFEKK
ncbi:hypothetical protein SH661x_002017 [Planctomicrobium sp. SH661]|uniref:hypothetical protein n=1 Tax=Planctomicrobium sp. SH661 TaxID=3448124 RepID=UPI003F5AFD07